MMKKQDLKKKSKAELTKHVAELREQLAYMQRNKYLSDEQNSAKKKLIRREIARSLTLTKSAEAVAEEAPKKAKESK